VPQFLSLSSCQMAGELKPSPLNWAKRRQMV